MKKVLSAFFAVFLSMTGGYCESASYVDTNLSSNDSMNSVISIRAIYEGFNINKCSYRIQSDVRDSIARIIGEIISQGRNITLKDFLSMCINLSDEDTENCIGCTVEIAKKHNELIKEQVNNIDIFTSEEEYNETLKTKGVCTSRNSRWKIEFNQHVRTEHGCKKTCKDYAIANACVLDGISFDGGRFGCECTIDYLSMSTQSLFTPYYVRPTWEDYKKLYNIK